MECTRIETEDFKVFHWIFQGSASPGLLVLEAAFGIMRAGWCAAIGQGTCSELIRRAYVAKVVSRRCGVHRLASCVRPDSLRRQVFARRPFCRLRQVAQGQQAWNRVDLL